MSSELVCNFCGKQFSSETLLNDHNRDVHTQVESPCNLCDKSFRSKKKLRYHITSTHAEKEAFQCDIKSDGIQCIYYATTNSNLRAHKKRVHDEKPTNANLAKHVCDLCDFRTNTKFNLDRHSEKCKILDPSHSCNLCNKTFSTKKNLTRHTKLHNRTNNDKPISDVSCVVCKKTFVNTWNKERP